jgi:hypothetical protein
MALVDRLPPKARNHGLPCSVAAILEQLDHDNPADGAELRKWLAAPMNVWPHSAIESDLREEGHSIGAGTVGKHRRGDCRCAREGTL